jgi:hypothetical protein
VLHTDKDTTTAEVGEEIPIKVGVNLFVFRRIKTDEIWIKKTSNGK